MTAPAELVGQGPLHAAYRLLVRALPKDFRARHSDDLMDCHVDAWRSEALGRGPITRMAFWMRAFGSILRTVIGQRWKASREPGGPQGQRGAGWDSWIQDLRYAVRQSVRRPIFTIVATLSLAIGVGGNTAIFSAVNVLFLRPVPGVVGSD